MSPRFTYSGPPACETAPLGIPGEPLPPQDDLVEISRQVLAHAPAGPGEWLLIRDPYLILLECGSGGLCDLSFWIAIPQLWGRDRGDFESRLPILPYCAYAPCSQPMPASDELMGLARDILNAPPARDGKSLLVRDPHIMVTKTDGWSPYYFVLDHGCRTTSPFHLQRSTTTPTSISDTSLSVGWSSLRTLHTISIPLSLHISLIAWHTQNLYDIWNGEGEPQRYFSMSYFAEWMLINV